MKIKVAAPKIRIWHWNFASMTCVGRITCNHNLVLVAEYHVDC